MELRQGVIGLFFSTNIMETQWWGRISELSKPTHNRHELNTGIQDVNGTQPSNFKKLNMFENMIIDKHIRSIDKITAFFDRIRIRVPFSSPLACEFLATWKHMKKKIQKSKLTLAIRIRLDPTLISNLVYLIKNSHNSFQRDISQHISLIMAAVLLVSYWREVMSTSTAGARRLAWWGAAAALVDVGCLNERRRSKTKHRASIWWGAPS